MSGWLLMGLPARCTSRGFGRSWIAVGLVVGAYLNWKFVAAPLRVYTERTRQRADAARLLHAPLRRSQRMLRVIIGGRDPGVLRRSTARSGIVAGARLFEALFGMPYHEAMFWGSVVTIIYTLVGGFLAVSWTDTVQGTLMIFALVLVAAMGVGLAGGRRVLGDARGARSGPARSVHRDRRPGARRDRHRLAAGLGSRLSRAAAHPRPLHGDPFGRRDPDRASVAMSWMVMCCWPRSSWASAGAAILAPAAARAPTREKVFIPLSTALPASGARGRAALGHPRGDHEHARRPVAGVLRRPSPRISTRACSGASQAAPSWCGSGAARCCWWRWWRSGSRSIRRAACSTWSRMPGPASARPSGRWSCCRWTGSA